MLNVLVGDRVNINENHNTLPFNFTSTASVYDCRSEYGNEFDLKIVNSRSNKRKPAEIVTLEETRDAYRNKKRGKVIKSFAN